MHIKKCVYKCEKCGDQLIIDHELTEEIRAMLNYKIKEILDNEIKEILNGKPTHKVKGLL